MKKICTAIFLLILSPSFGEMQTQGDSSIAPVNLSPSVLMKPENATDKPMPSDTKQLANDVKIKVKKVEQTVSSVEKEAINQAISAKSKEIIESKMSDQKVLSDQEKQKLIDDIAKGVLEKLKQDQKEQAKETKAAPVSTTPTQKKEDAPVADRKVGKPIERAASPNDNKPVNCVGNNVLINVVNDSPYPMVLEDLDAKKSTVISAKSSSALCVPKGSHIDGYIKNNKGIIIERMPVQQLMWFTKKLEIEVDEEGQMELDLETTRDILDD